MSYLFLFNCGIFPNILQNITAIRYMRRMLSKYINHTARQFIVPSAASMESHSIVNISRCQLHRCNLMISLFWSTNVLIITMLYPFSLLMCLCTLNVTGKCPWLGAKCGTTNTQMVKHMQNIEIIYFQRKKFPSLLKLAKILQEHMLTQSMIRKKTLLVAKSRP